MTSGATCFIIPLYRINASIEAESIKIMGEVSYKVLSNEVWDNGAYDLVQYWHSVSLAANLWKSNEWVEARSSKTRADNAYMDACIALPDDTDDCTLEEIENVGTLYELYSAAQEQFDNVVNHDNVIRQVLIAAVESAKLKAYQEFASTNPDFVVIENWDEQDYFSSDIPEDDTSE